VVRRAVRVSRPGSAISRRRIVRAARQVLVLQAELPDPAREVVGEAGDHRPGGVGGEAPRGEVGESLILQVADRKLDLGVVAVPASTVCMSSSRLVRKAKLRQ